MTSVNVSIADLRRGLSILLDEIQRRHGHVVDLEADYYWTIGPQDAFRFTTSAAPEPTVGQLVDDLATLHDLVARGASRPVVAWHDLAHVIGVLTRLAAIDQEAADQHRPAT